MCDVTADLFGISGCTCLPPILVPCNGGFGSRVTKPVMTGLAPYYRHTLDDQKGNSMARMTCEFEEREIK